MRTGTILAAAGLLAGCVGADSVGRTSYRSTEGNGSSTRGVNGNSGIGSTGPNGSNGTAGGNGNSIGGNGGDGVDGAPGANGANGANGASSSGSGSMVGSGHLASRVIALPGVTSVVTEASFVVHVTVGEPEQATIRIDDNLTDRVDATVTNGTLHLGLKPGSNIRNATLSAEITVRELDRLNTSGASQVTLVSRVTGPALQLVVSGASKVTGPLRVDHLNASESGDSVLALSGHVGDLHLSAAGTSQLLGTELTVANLNALLSGASQATVAVSDTLAATTEGVSVLSYHGTPSITRRRTFGTSSIMSNSGK